MLCLFQDERIRVNIYTLVTWHHTRSELRAVDTTPSLPSQSPSQFQKNTNEWPLSWLVSTVKLSFMLCSNPVSLAFVTTTLTEDCYQTNLCDNNNTRRLISLIPTSLTSLSSSPDKSPALQGPDLLLGATDSILCQHPDNKYHDPRLSVLDSNKSLFPIQRCMHHARWPGQCCPEYDSSQNTTTILTQVSLNTLSLLPR